LPDDLRGCQRGDLLRRVVQHRADGFADYHQNTIASLRMFYLRSVPKRLT
jgi:hypothetical protein